MKHGISPTTPRGKRWARGTILHLSKALVQRVIDFSTADENGRVKVQYLPLHLQAPDGAVTRIVVAPDKGITYRRPGVLDDVGDKTFRRGLRRRYALSGRELTAERLEDRRMQMFGLTLGVDCALHILKVMA